MTRDELQTASDELRQAAESASDELGERLHDQSNQLARLATAERGPDHGRLDRHMNALSEMTEQAEGEVREHIQAAREQVKEYRKGVEGV